MANVYLRTYRGQDVIDLPPVCMVCGAPAAVRKRKQFSWQPSWVPGLIIAVALPYIVVSLLMTKRQTVETPLCDRHSTYWWLFPTLLVVSILGIFGFGFLAFVAINSATQPGSGRGGSDAAGLVCIATIVVFIVWLIVAVIM